MTIKEPDPHTRRFYISWLIVAGGFLCVAISYSDHASRLSQIEKARTIAIERSKDDSDRLIKRMDVLEGENKDLSEKLHTLQPVEQNDRIYLRNCEIDEKTKQLDNCQVFLLP